MNRQEQAPFEGPAPASNHMPAPSVLRARLQSAVSSTFMPALAVYVLALLVCIIYNLTVARDYFPLHDSLGYQNIAFNLLDKGCYCWNTDGVVQGVTVSHAPLWPWLIAELSLLFGRANLVDRLFLCLIDAGTCLLIYFFVRDLFNKRLALIAGLFACVYPALYIYTGWMYTEALSTFLQMAVCYCVLRIQRSEGKSRRLWLLCGALLALLALAHPNGVAIVVVLVLWVAILFWRRRLPREALLNAGLSVLVACLLIAPWTIRNYVVSQSFVLVASGSGTVLLGAYNNDVLAQKGNPGWLGQANSDPQVYQRFLGKPCYVACQIDLENVETDAAIQWVKSHPQDMPVMLYYHVSDFFQPYTAEADMPLDRFPSISTKIVLDMSTTFPLLVYLLAGLGLVVTLRRFWSQLLFAYLVILATLAEILVFYGNARFRSLIEPLLIILAAGALWWLTASDPGTLRWRLNQRRE